MQNGMCKEALRNEIKARKRHFSGLFGEMSLAHIRRLLAHPRIVEAQTVLMYCSLSDEVDTHAALDRLVAMGKTVLLPRVTGPDTMELRVYSSPDDLQIGAFHIEEPKGILWTDYAHIDVAVVPGLAFDAQGHRLGRGRGYYDRLLPGLAAYKIGLCFDFQRVEEVPCDVYDMPVDEVL